MNTKICSDLDALDLTFRAQVEKLLAIMVEKGWKPLVWETYRSRERAEELRKRGTSKNGNLSMHCIGLAVDIVDADTHNGPDVGTKESYWNAPPKFWADLEDGAVSLGLTRLFHPGTKDVAGKADSWDLPHCQAIKVADQARVRLMDAAERAKFVLKKFEALATK
jgi:hypothetical protein